MRSLSNVILKLEPWTRNKFFQVHVLKLMIRLSFVYEEWLIENRKNFIDESAVMKRHLIQNRGAATPVIHWWLQTTQTICAWGRATTSRQSKTPLGLLPHKVCTCQDNKPHKFTMQCIIKIQFLLSAIYVWSGSHKMLRRVRTCQHNPAISVDKSTRIFTKTYTDIRFIRSE